MSEALDRAARLAAMGLEIRSVELTAEARQAQVFAKHGNRAMRRAAARRKK